MSRAQRLLDLIQLLRGYRRPVSGAVLAEALGISLRTLYRDIETLNAQGAQIDGEPGVGYVLRPGFMLPPLMFSEEEIEAIVLGSRWVADRTDAALSGAATQRIGQDIRRASAGPERQSRYVGPADRAGKSDRRRRCRTAGHSLGDPDRAQVARIAIRTAADAVQSATSGLSRWAFSTACASSWRGANSAKAFGISAPTASARCRSSTSAIRAAARSC